MKHLVVRKLMVAVSRIAINIRAYKLIDRSNLAVLYPIIFVLSFCSSTLIANENEVKVQDVTPDVLVSDATESLLKKIAEARREQKDFSFYYQAVNDTVAPFVDFDLISRRVMGRYYKEASASERNNFVGAFKESLLSTYAKGLVSYRNQEVTFLPFKGARSVKGITRAKVQMEIRGDGSDPFPVTYSMYVDKQQEWKLENITLNGVNLGLTFRNQFNQAYKDNDGDLSKIIAGWNMSLVDQQSQ